MIGPFTRVRGPTAAHTLSPLAGNLWESTAGDAPELAPLQGRTKIDVAVIGAGVTGLSAALHMAKSGRQVVVVDAGKVGSGATGRASGQILPALKSSPETIEQRFGRVVGAGLNDWSGRAADTVFDLVERWQIDCSAHRAGCVQAAYTPRELRVLRSWSRQWRARGADVRDLDRGELTAILGTSVYLGGILDTRGGSVHPLRYAFGLARAAISSGAIVHIDTPVECLRRDGDGWRLETRNGPLLCGSVVVATNAYSGNLVDGLSESIVSIPASQATTRPLPEPILKEILPGGQVASDRRRMLVSFRISPCGRFIIGGPGGTGEATGADLHRAARKATAELFGHLGRFEWEYGWSCHVALSRDAVPHLHEPEPGLHVALGYNGQGLALGTALGKLVAERVNGRTASTLEVPLTPIRPIPFHRLAPPVIAAGERLLSVMDRVERRVGF